jgi:hypothetical protein
MPFLALRVPFLAFRVPFLAFRVPFLAFRVPLLTSYPLLSEGEGGDLSPGEVCPRLISPAASAASR